MAERELASDTLGLLKVINEPAQFIIPGEKSHPSHHQLFRAISRVSLIPVPNAVQTRKLGIFVSPRGAPANPTFSPGPNPRSPSGAKPKIKLCRYPREPEGSAELLLTGSAYSRIC